MSKRFSFGTTTTGDPNSQCGGDSGVGVFDYDVVTVGSVESLQCGLLQRNGPGKIGETPHSSSWALPSTKPLVLLPSLPPPAVVEIDIVEKLGLLDLVDYSDTMLERSRNLVLMC